ncbi:hypothetical protein BT93_L3982 [Corymbia citriodora subsp. variegata]|uniref:Uncharacterized protein n=1 Tax=Corymbia citriodora subsp. variegata TaxID=360336 RepID=A0A8T0CGN2_CORYI|nr:hypothetical protein BT93_L3982 [Corymbia citriodora subsp. variegata]
MGASESKGREENGENKESSSTAALAAGAFAGAAILALGASVVIMMGELSEPSEEEKTMKAPGRDMRIPRRAFEGNPKGYFKNLRSDLRKK